MHWLILCNFSPDQSHEILHQNTHWKESGQMQRVQQFINHIIRHMLNCSPIVERNHTQVHRMQKVIQPSWKSEHSYAHSHWGESPHLCTVQKVIQTNWKIDGAHIHRQWGKATQLNYRVQKVIQQSWNLGQTFAYAHWGKAPPLNRA